MPKRKKPLVKVPIHGKKLSLVVAALMAQEADRLGVLLGEVGELGVPEPAPTHVRIARHRLSIATAAAIATVAASQRTHPRRVLESILEEHTDALDRRARTRKTKRTLEGAGQLSSDASRRGGGKRGKG